MSESETVDETFLTSLVGKEDVVILTWGSKQLDSGDNSRRGAPQRSHPWQPRPLGWMSGQMDRYNEQYFSLDRLEF